MARLSAVLRSVQSGFAHWCPACEEMHVIPTAEPYKVRWDFNQNVEMPTFTPSMRITHCYGDEREDRCCHYILHCGTIDFCGDCTHALAGKSVPLPVIPDCEQLGLEGCE